MSVLPVAPEPRNLTLREALYLKYRIADPDMLDSEALTKAGFGPGVIHNPSRVVTEEMRGYVENVRARAIEASLQEGYFDAREVLSELIRSLARQIAGLERLHAMLGHDIKELYSVSGALRAVSDWPEVWRTRLVTEVETREEMERSHDGATKDKEGGWDKAGEIKKIKRESTLGIEREIRNAEKEIRETLETIGKHIEVKAFPVHGDKLADAVGDLAGSIDRAIAEGRQRASQRNRLPKNVTPTE